MTGLIADAIKISSAEGKSAVYNAKEAMSVFINRLDEIYEARDTGGTGLKTGIATLDESMGGMHPSDMAIVGARPGVGKTAFAVSIMRNVAKQGKRVGFFSTEMSVFQVMSRFVSIESKINAHKLRQADLDELDFARITAATSAIMGFNLRICDKPAITIGELSMQARAWAADGGLDFIAVNYLTRLHPDKVGFNQNLDVGLIVTGLKNLARNLNVPVMVLAQLNRSGAQRKDKRPVMSDLRDSGIIEQEADQILMLYRPDEDSETEFPPEIVIEKNRHGECGIVRCEFEKSTMHWRDVEAGYDA
jgi:replicative DNA helicase